MVVEALRLPCESLVRTVERLAAGIGLNEAVRADCCTFAGELADDCAVVIAHVAPATA